MTVSKDSSKERKLNDQVAYCAKCDQGKPQDSVKKALNKTLICFNYVLDGVAIRTST